VIGWVAIRRHHHAFTDRPGDPHSPYRYGDSVAGQLRGLAHAHAGWLLRDAPTRPSRYAPDMLADPAMRVISAAFPALCAVSLALPFGAGWLTGGTWRTALTALLWAGLVRVAVLQHVTWSVNSLCHVFGTRPFATRRHDRATNLWPLALISFGESWHNMHHSDPAPGDVLQHGDADQSRPQQGGKGGAPGAASEPPEPPSSAGRAGENDTLRSPARDRHAGKQGPRPAREWSTRSYP
jgi:fatty-acid desaturase